MCLSGGDDRDPLKEAVKSSSAAIFARILVMNTNYLAQLTAEPSLLLFLHNSGVTIEENVLLCLIDLWLDKVSRVWTCRHPLYHVEFPASNQIVLPLSTIHFC